MASSTVARRFARAGITLAFVAGIGLIWLRTGAGWTPSEASTSPSTSGTVLVVNADRPLPDDFAVPDLVPLVNKVPVADKQVLIATKVERPLRRLFTAARKAGHTRLYVASGYRTAEEQQQLWDAAEDKSFVQRPGHSEHQTGLAVDLADLKVGQGKFGASKAGRWLARNAWRYGFILRYPAGKEQVMGISYEPWHYRYVGTAVAKACHQGHLVLEEYVAAH